MTLRRHSLTLDGHRTSVAIEDEFWVEICRIARDRGCSAARLVAEIDEARTSEDPPPNLSSALRLFVLAEIKGRAAR
ncbi:MAG: ribbon-helix-helix domain-containing protein [Alphaproteobacteria bacterium]